MNLRWNSVMAVAAVALSGVNAKDGVEIRVSVDANATTTTTHTIHYVPPVLQDYPTPSPFPAPTPDGTTFEPPLLPSPSYTFPSPGPDSTIVCDVSDGCVGQSCDDLPDITCAALEKNYGCDCGGCRCKNDKVDSNNPSPAPMEDMKSYKCTADCVEEGASCDFWEFNTCEFLESSKGCDCSGCECTGGTCTSDMEDDVDSPECEEWCGSTMTEWESCEYCRCKACDFCVIGANDPGSLQQYLDDVASASHTTLVMSVAVAAIVAQVAMRV